MSSTKTASACRKQFFVNNKQNYVITLLAVFISSGVNVSLAFIMKTVTESMEKLDLGLLRNALFLSLGTAAAALLTGLMQKKYRNRYMKVGLTQFKMYVFDKLLRKSIDGFANAGSGRFISAFSNDLSSIEANYLASNINITTQATLFIGGVGAMFFINWRLMCCVLATSFMPAVIALKFGNNLTRREKQTSAKNTGFVEQVKELLDGFVVIKSFKAENEVLQLFGRQNTELEETKRKRRETNDMISLLNDSSYTIVTILLVVVGCFFVFRGSMTIGGVFAFVQLSGYVLDPIKRMVPLFSNRKAAVALIDKLAGEIEDERDDAEKIKAEDFRKDITFENVSFAYEEGKTVLQGINLHFEKGKSYAVVGNSGSGKSTLLKLLMGHFGTYGGSIRIDDTELRDISLHSLYDLVSVIQQNVFLFDSSIRDNITMFKDFPEEEYDRAVLLAGLKTLTERKGDSYICGENGSALSGGEKQRVSIARCLIRRTPILLMDEATASLDNETCFAVSNSILDIRGLTKIIVTHKLTESIMRRYDEIIVINEGCVVQQGSFDALLLQNGIFSSLFRITQKSNAETIA